MPGDDFPTLEYRRVNAKQPGLRVRDGVIGAASSPFHVVLAELRISSSLCQQLACICLSFSAEVHLATSRAYTKIDASHVVKCPLPRSW